MNAKRISVTPFLMVAAAAVLTACGSTTAGSAIPVATVVTTTAAAPSTTLTTLAQPPQTIYVQPPPARTYYVQPADTPEGHTVTAYYDALNRADFTTAWNLGGSRLAGRSGYTTYVRGFATTAWVTMTISSVNGNTVSVSLSALQSDGSIRTFAGTYTVSGGVIVGSHMARTG